jgi:hypothetical protein
MYHSSTITISADFLAAQRAEISEHKHRALADISIRALSWHENHVHDIPGPHVDHPGQADLGIFFFQ